MALRSIRRVSAVTVMAALGVFGCGGSKTNNPPVPADVTQFFESYAQLHCMKMQNCDTGVSLRTLAECEAGMVARLQDERLAAYLASGVAVFDANAAAACLALLRDAPACAASWSEDYCFEDATVFVGGLGVGSACDSDHTWYCAPGTVCSVDRLSNACGTCVARALSNPGEPCDRSVNCRQTATRLAYCDFDPVDVRNECMVWANPTVVALGASCDADGVVCGADASCDGNTDIRCHPRLAIGDECVKYGDIQCVVGADCVEDPSSTLGGYCRQVSLSRGVGDACGLVGITWFECDDAASLVCDPGTNHCVRRTTVGIGADCNNDNCDPGLYCDYSAPTGNVCAPLRGLGESCVWDEECASFVCAGAGTAKTCAEPTGIAGACAP